MTFKEKHQKECPEGFNKDGCPIGCPDHNGYEKETHCDEMPNCEMCWNREIPTTKDGEKS